MSEIVKPQYRAYYRFFYGMDAVMPFKDLESMKREIRLHRAEDFDYINACFICDDGSEEIVAAGVEEILKYE